MEKWTPHCKLSNVKRLITEGHVRATMSALRGAAEFGMDFDGMLKVVNALTAQDFHKSMTTYSDHRIWQDVYRPVTAFGQCYLKLTVIDDVLIVSFKEL